MSFYDSINYQINLYKPKIQGFIDKTTAVINALRSNKDVVINTKELFLSLDTARQMAQTRFSNISKITEVDYQINFKKRILNEERILGELLHRDFEQCLIIFKNSVVDRFEKSSSLMLPKLAGLNDAIIDVRNAKSEFKTKYRFTR